MKDLKLAELRPEQLDELRGKYASGGYVQPQDDLVTFGPGHPTSSLQQLVLDRLKLSAPRSFVVSTPNGISAVSDRFPPNGDHRVEIGWSPPDRPGCPKMLWYGQKTR